MYRPPTQQVRRQAARECRIMDFYRDLQLMIYPHKLVEIFYRAHRSKVEGPG